MIKKALLCISGFLLFPSLNQAQVTLTVGTGSGYRGSHNNPVSVSLSNPSDPVRKVQVDVCDVDDYLDVLKCEPTARGRDGFTCGVIPLSAGCARLILYSPGGIIPAGTGSIMTIRYNVSAGAPAGQSRAINQKNILVYNEQGGLLTVTPVSGSFTFSSCSSSEQCQDGLFCNGTEACSSGACTHTGNPCPGSACKTCQEDSKTCFDPAGTPCADDGLFCNGNEICNGSGSCIHEGSPCPHATCVEATDECTCFGPGEYCDDGKFCNGDEYCLFGVCEHVGNPCASRGLHCAEAVGRCICFVDAECDDANDCTDDRCEADGSCRHLNNTAPCDDGIFCNGVDTCNCGSCSHAGNPCTYPNVCYENTKTCAARQVELTLGFGSGAIGTMNRQVNVQMKNPAKYVNGMQIEVCDENDYLITTGCTVSSAAPEHLNTKFDCSVNELSNGCATAVLTPKGSTPISPNSTMRTVFNIGFDVSPCRTRGAACTGCGAACYQPGTSCAAGTAGCYRYDRNKLCSCNETGCYSLQDACPPADTGDFWVTLDNFLVVDPWDNVLGALAVPTPFANFSVTCDSHADCARGSVCSNDTCSGGKCVHTPTGTVNCDDGLFCTKTDRCSGGFCVGTGDTCGSVFLCDEAADQCFSCPGDADCDGVPDASDNCPGIPNGPGGGVCLTGSTMETGCLEHCDCALSNGYCSTAQEDSYPPGGNNLGDACECEADFDCDGDVDGMDAVKLKKDFGRGKIKNPCTNTSICKGDFDCDGDVDGKDAIVLKKDFGRGSMKNPCPPCVTEVWCNYP